MSKKDELLEILRTHCKGKARARSGKALQEILHLSRCQLNRHINRLRREGNPIGSFRGGYYYAENAGELYSTIIMLILKPDKKCKTLFIAPTARQVLYGTAFQRVFALKWAVRSAAFPDKKRLFLSGNSIKRIAAALEAAIAGLERAMGGFVGGDAS